MDLSFHPTLLELVKYHSHPIPLKSYYGAFNTEIGERKLRPLPCLKPSIIAAFSTPESLDHAPLRGSLNERDTRPFHNLYKESGR